MELNDITNIKSTINPDLIINFDTDSENQIKIFLKENFKTQKYYMGNNFTICMDLVESNYLMYLWLVDCVKIANNLILNSSKYIQLFSNLNVWNINICDNIMFNYPFTLSNIIFLPISYIETCYKMKNANDKKKFIETLIHEKIHISQREMELVWEKFIKSNSKNWIKIKSNTELYDLIENFTNNKNIGDKNIGNKYCWISNPDTYYPTFKYIFYSENKYYYGHYVWNKKKSHIEKKYFIFDIDKKKFVEITNELDELKEEHPYEIYAYKIAKELVL